MSYIRLTKAEQDYLQAMGPWLVEVRKAHADYMEALPPKIRETAFVARALQRQDDLYMHLERLVALALRVGMR